MIAKLKNYLLCVVKALPEISIGGYWLSEEIDKSITDLKLKLKLTFTATHPGNNKQVSSLAVTIFDETTTVTIKSYYPNRLAAANFINLFDKVFCYLQLQTNYLTLQGFAIFNSFANWIEIWSLYHAFTFTMETSHALVTTMRAD